MPKMAELRPTDASPFVTLAGELVTDDPSVN
jgi:hypothetical protein